ncbi:GNAT family N-acetyltransferase [Chitinimonas naiadis]
MQIRSTTEQDWQALKTIRLASLQDAPLAFGMSYEETLQFSDALWRERASPLTQPNFWLAWDGDEAVGIVGGVETQGEYQLISLWVAPMARGKRVAEQLVQAVADKARALRHPEVVLSVAPENVSACKLYTRLGFRFLDHTEVLDSHPEVTVQKMVLVLV